MAKPWESVVPGVEEAARPPLLERVRSDVNRGAELAARAVVQGAAGLATPFADPLAFVLNRGLQAIGQDPMFPENHRRALSEQLTNLGLAEPEGFAENALSLGAEMATGAAASSYLTPMILERLGLRAPTYTAEMKTARGPRNVEFGANVGANMAIPGANELRAAAKEAYKAIDDAGVVVRADSYGKALGQLQPIARGLGYNARLHPRIAAALDEAAGMTDDISFGSLEVYRRVLGNAAASADPSERKIAQALINTLDDYVMGMTAADVSSGNATAVFGLIRQARDLYTRSSRGMEIENLIVKARNSAPNFSASGLENSIRTQFRQLANNPRRLRVFTPAQQAAIRRVARGGPLENTLRMIGKLAPTGAVSAGLGGGLGGGAGYAVGGPAGAAAGAATVFGIGTGARLGATGLTLRNANNVSKMVRAGASVAPDAGRAAAVTAGASPAVVNFLFGELGQEPETTESRKPWER